MRQPCFTTSLIVRYRSHDRVATGCVVNHGVVNHGVVNHGVVNRGVVNHGVVNHGVVNRSMVRVLRRRHHDSPSDRLFQVEGFDGGFPRRIDIQDFKQVRHLENFLQVFGQIAEFQLDARRLALFAERQEFADHR